MTSPEENLKNLAKVQKIKEEKTSPSELRGLLLGASNHLKDAENLSNSLDSRFNLAYNAAHSIALAALRRSGYRATDRYVVFQVLPHTLGSTTKEWRLLNEAHQRRNVALYEGELNVDESLLKEIIFACKRLYADLTNQLGIKI